MDSSQSISSVAERVRDTRSRMHMTQAQFAEQMAVTPLAVHRWETGQSRPRTLALERLRALEEAASNREAADHSEAERPLPTSRVPPDFAGDPAAVLLVAEAYRLAHGHQFNAAFASETARIDPLPHQRIAVYERMLPQEPLRFLLADDAGAGKTIMTGLYVREMLFRRRIHRVLIVPPAGLVGNWERELRTLFRLRCRIVSGTDCRDGANPFVGTDGDRVIVSGENCPQRADWTIFSETCPARITARVSGSGMGAEAPAGDRLGGWARSGSARMPTTGTGRADSRAK